MTDQIQHSGSPADDLRVVLDTNAIYSATTGYLLAYETQKLIEETRLDPHLNVSWYLPQIVLDERRYQIQQEAAKLRSSVRNLEKVIRHTSDLTDSLIQDRIASSVTDQVRKHGLVVCACDPRHIDWGRLMTDAVTRTPPFDPELEKGFRDALILEALKQLVTVSAEECRFVFVTNDGLLGKAAQSARLPRVEVLKSIDDVRSLINARLSAVTKEEVAAWQITAKEYFFSEQTQSGLFVELNVASRIREECPSALTDLPSNGDRRQNEGKWLIAPGPTFVKKDRARVWWASRVKMRSKVFSSVPQYDLYGVYGRPAYYWDVQNPWVPQGNPESSGPLATPGDLARALRADPIRTYATVPMYQVEGGRLEFPSGPDLLHSRLAVARGMTTVVVTWSAVIDHQRRFSQPRVESIEPSGTEWQLGQFL